MGLLDPLKNFGQGLPAFAGYIWVLYIFVPLALIIFGGWVWKLVRDKKKQWTHKLIIERELTNGQLSDPITIKMKRFPLVNNAAVFELETPFLGSYLIPEMDSYTGLNQFSIIVSKNNRIFIKTGTKFNPDDGSKIVSAKHAAIDLAFEELKEAWQHQHTVNKRVEWAQVAKWAMLGLLIIAVMVVSIKGIGQWGENHQHQANQAQSMAIAMENLADAMQTIDGTVNTQVLLADLLKEEYGTNNLQNIIREKTNGSS